MKYSWIATFIISHYCGTCLHYFPLLWDLPSLFPTIVGLTLSNKFSFYLSDPHISFHFMLSVEICSSPVLKTSCAQKATIKSIGNFWSVYQYSAHFKTVLEWSLRARLCPIVKSLKQEMIVWFLRRFHFLQIYYLFCIFR